MVEEAYCEALSKLESLDKVAFMKILTERFAKLPEDHPLHLPRYFWNEGREDFIRTVLFNIEQRLAGDKSISRKSLVVEAPKGCW